MSILLTLYFLALLTFLGVFSFALYRVWLFSQHKEIAGKSMLVATGFIFVAGVIIFVSFIGLSQFVWNDDPGYYLEFLKGLFSQRS